MAPREKDFIEDDGQYELSPATKNLIQGYSRQRRVGPHQSIDDYVPGTFAWYGNQARMLPSFVLSTRLA